MSAKEAKARIKINKLLETAGWRFFDDENGPANIQVVLLATIIPNRDSQAARLCIAHCFLRYNNGKQRGGAT